MSKPLTEEERLHRMVWAIDPKGALAASGMDIASMAKRAMTSYEADVPGAADQTKQIKDLRRRLHYASEETYNLQNRLSEVMGSALWNLFGAQKYVENILSEINRTDGEA